jgi:hypothetical protein
MSDDRWIFTPDRMWIERRDGTVVEERADPRASFIGHVRETRWDRLHLAYFGYAPRRVVRRTRDRPLISGRTSFVLNYLDVVVRQ